MRISYWSSYVCSSDLWSQVIHVGQYVEHASREDILRELSQHQRGDRRRRRGLENEAVAKQQGRSEFERGQQQREVPGRDTADHAKSLAVHLDAMGFIVLNDFNRNVDGCEIADQTFGKGNLHAGFRQWLALFAHKHARKPIGIGPDGVGQAEKLAAAFLKIGSAHV